MTAMSKATVGKILGALGLVSLLSAPYTYFITASLPLTLVKAVLGVGLIGAYFATNYRQLNQFASRRSTFYVDKILRGPTRATCRLSCRRDSILPSIARLPKRLDLPFRPISCCAPTRSFNDRVDAVAFRGRRAP